MAQLVLEHCVPLKVHPPDPPPDPAPESVDVHVVVGGLPGEGNVDVISGSSDGPVERTIGTGESDTVPMSGGVEIWLHYCKLSEEADTVDVDCLIEPA